MGAAATAAVLLTSAAVIGFGGAAGKRHVQPQEAVVASKKATQEPSTDGLSNIGGIPPPRFEGLDPPGVTAAIGGNPLLRLEDLERPGAFTAR